jgi:hypothetical protein
VSAHVSLQPQQRPPTFEDLGVIAVILGLVLALATPAIRRLMSGVH